MPILKENRKLYPKNWKEISEDIRFNRAKNKCEVCGVDNYSNGYWIEDEFILAGFIIECLDKTGRTPIDSLPADQKPIRIVLTVAHLDHNPQNCDYSNLKAMCQRCHNRYDAPHRKNTRKYKNQISIEWPSIK